ncbi:MAG: L,D-transpeptidase family protein, partial [Chthoniobacterales bacterium]|nr:L,D-transpeptidase family protein [Chthoniobacterales bacterium]
PVATGRRSFPTPTGNFTIIEKKKTYSSNLYGKILDAEGKVINPDADLRTAIIPEGGQFVGSPMPFWMRLTNDGVGLHVGHIPGRPASHGCIRIPRTAAQKIFSIAPIGTPVQITQHWEPQGLITANRPNP